MKISVVLATYNGERFLFEQLKSLSSQTRLPDELLVSDDGSLDRTLEIVHEYSATVPFDVRIQQNPQRLGPEENFLHAAASARGDIVAFCDQDDVWRPEKLARCVPHIEGGATLVIHSGEVVDEALRPLGFRFPNVRRSRSASAPHLPVWPTPAWAFAMVFARKLLDLADPARRPASEWANPLMSHEEWVYFLASAVGTVVSLRDVLVQYRQHDANASAGATTGIGFLVEEASKAGKDMYLRRATVARDRAEFLDALAQTTPSAAPLICARARLYERAAVANTRRSYLYDDHLPLPKRTLRLAGLIANGDYRPGTHGGLGRRALLKDVVVAVLGRLPGPSPAPTR